jgi:hypothetical protein
MFTIRALVETIKRKELASLNKYSLIMKVFISSNTGLPSSAASGVDEPELFETALGYFTPKQPEYCLLSAPALTQKFTDTSSGSAFCHDK